MGNIIIKLFILIIFWFNVPHQSVSAQEKINQLFYMFNGESIESLEENLKILNTENIPVIFAINPETNLHSGQIKQIQKLQNKFHFDIILEQEDELNQTSFVTKGYDEKLHIAGIYQLTTKELIYRGKETVSFKNIYLPLNPVKVLEEKEQLSKKSNNAICIDEHNFNSSNILLFQDQLNGKELDLNDYVYEIEATNFIYRLFSYLGDISIVLFSFAIVVFAAAILVFRKWSLENFLE